MPTQLVTLYVEEPPLTHCVDGRQLAETEETEGIVCERDRQL